MRFRIVAFFAVIVFVAGCSASSPGRSALSHEPGISSVGTARNIAQISQNVPQLRTIRRVIIAPVEVGERERERVQQVSRLFYFMETAALQRLDMEFVNPKELTRRSDTLRAEGQWKEEVLPLAARDHADAVLVATVKHVVQRQGSRLGASQPAELSLQMDLYQLDGTRVWGAAFQYRDQALNENLFKIDRKLSLGGGAGWQDVEQLQVAAVQQLVDNLATARNASFLEESSRETPSKSRIPFAGR